MNDPLLSIRLAGNAQSILRPLLIALVVGLAVVLIAASESVTTVEVMIPGVLIVAVLGALYFLKSGRVAAASYLLIGTLLGAGAVGIAAYGSIRSVASLSLVGAVAVAGVFLGRRALVGTMVLTSAIVGALVYAEATGAMTSLNRPVGWLHWLVFSVGCTLIGLAVHYARLVALEAHAGQQQELRERVLADATIRRTEERLRLSMEATHQGWFDLDIPSGTVVASEQYARMVGAEPGSPDLTLQVWMDSIHDDDRATVMAAFQECLASGEARQMDYRLRTQGSAPEWLWVRSIGQVVEWDEQHRPLRMAGTHTDLSDHMRGIAALRESEERFRAVVEMSPAGMVIVDDGRITYVNPAATRIVGAGSPDQMVGRSTLDFVRPDYWAATQQRTQRAKETGRAVQPAESVYVRLDGSQVEVESVGMPITISGRPSMLAVFQDITARKQADEALRSSEERYRSMFELAINGILQTTLEGKAIAANPAFVRMLGYSSEEEVLRTLTDLPRGLWAHSEERAIVAGLIEAHGFVRGYECEFVRKDGERIWISLNASVAHGHGASGSFFQSSIDDITARKRAEAENAALEAQLRQAQKMESVGRLAGGVAHDFNNMLGVILGRTELAVMKIDPAHPARSDLAEVHDAAQRSADLTRQLLTYARKQTVTPARMDLNDAVARASQMLARLIGERIHLEWHPGAGLWPVYMDASQLDQVLVNLCVNAKDAIHDVGILRIATENCVLDAPFCAAHTDVAPGEYVRLTVSDTGHGMSLDVTPHIFEPFFTTKGVGEGTGLGLATVYGAVRQHNGFVTVSSSVGEGTTFAVYLPRHSGPASVSSPAGLGAVPARSHETILVVEDEASLLRLTTSMLELQGYLVLAASNPARALELSAAHPGGIDLLLTDVVMPGMNGRRLASAIRAQRPGIECLFMSGFEDDVDVGPQTLEDAARFIGKPFTMAALNAKVRGVLARA